jgi:hypothetical protein
MKKYLFLAAMVAALVSCSQESEPTQKKQVSFSVSAFTVNQQPMDAPRRAPILDDADGQPLTDLYLFDGKTLLVHQTSDQEDFGTISLQLDYGQHSLSFVATRSAGLSYENGILSCTSLRPYFGKLLALNVTASTGDQDIVLNRVTGMLIVNIEDAVPANCAKVNYALGTRYADLNVETLAGVNGAAWNSDINFTSKVGLTNQSVNLNLLAATYGTAYTTTVTITAYNSGNTIIAQKIVENVPINSNVKTTVSGSLFTGNGFSISANHTWGDSEAVSY